MSEQAGLIDGLIWILLTLVPVAITNSNKHWQGKKWLRVFLWGNFVLAVLRFVPGLLESWNMISYDTYTDFWYTMAMPVRIIHCIIWCTLVPYVWTVSRNT